METITWEQVRRGDVIVLLDDQQGRGQEKGTITRNVPFVVRKRARIRKKKAVRNFLRNIRGSKKKSRLKYFKEFEVKRVSLEGVENKLGNDSNRDFCRFETKHKVTRFPSVAHAKRWLFLRGDASEYEIE